jgi:lysyl-tRNA synthetase class 1
MSADAAEIVTPEWVEAVLDQFEKAQCFDESDVAGQILAAAKKVESPTAEEKKAADAECWAFNFYPQTPGELSEWKTHFGPSFVRGEFRNPDIAWLDQAVLKYWEKRMAVVKHPLLRARYADLVWDLSKPACSLKAPIDAARIAIDGYVAVGALADADSAMAAADRLHRGLRLAVSVGDQPRAEQARDALVALFTRVNEIWAWVSLFDMFEESPKIKLTDAQKDAMVAGLEAHVTGVAAKPEGVDPGGSLHVAARLVRHYQRAGSQSDANRVVMACGQAAERYTVTADHTRAHFWLDQVFKFYRINGLDTEAERVQLEARRRGDCDTLRGRRAGGVVSAPGFLWSEHCVDLYCRVRLVRSCRSGRAPVPSARLGRLTLRAGTRTKRGKSHEPVDDLRLTQ